MFITILFNNQGERTQGECVVRANGPDTLYYQKTKSVNSAYIDFL